MTKILITEDDETIRTALAVILGDNGFCPITASSCEQALQLFDECDLCLLYLISALPIALMLAFATGRLIISKITDLKIFDALYESEVSERFFRLEISAPIMILIITITVFSVLLSAYAAADLQDGADRGAVLLGCFNCDKQSARHVGCIGDIQAY